MPSKNTVKRYQENSFYHVYNRGVEKRDIFLDDQDFRVLLYYFKIYLSPPSYLKEYMNQKLAFGDLTKLSSALRAQEKTFYNKIELHCYALMPNHYHLVLKQVSSNDMKVFVQSIFTKYALYFNKRYARVGGLFQGAYKAKIVNEDSQFLHLCRYIHLNPKEISPLGHTSYEKWTSWKDYPYSSCRYYLESVKPAPIWLKTGFTNSFFPTPSHYRQFLEQYIEEKHLEVLEDTVLEKVTPLKVSPYKV